ncbi:MAG TPA: DNA helicase PcrA [Clostridia bacterium]|nr:DNA helicase PcrA [Clostridia bacterium]
MDFEKQLNPAQLKAVQHTEGPLLVLAGAGSGKTRVLAYRIAYLLKEKRVSPYNILAITFTNKAAKEMRTRVEGLVPNFGGRGFWISTFHAACLRILRRNIDSIGRDSNFVIYDDSEQITVIKDCLHELDLDVKKYTPRSISAVISNAKNSFLDPEAYIRRAVTFFERVAGEVYGLYQEKMLGNNALDFDDLLLLTVRLFESDPEVLDYYQERFRYILIDEYQDTNYCQYRLVNLLAQKYRNLCVVGDPDQGIYGWRGADISNILNFERDYPEALVIKLEQNYRSTETILDAANCVISNNRGRKEKDLWTAKGKGAPITVCCCTDEREEAQFVAGQIRALCSVKNYTYNDFAVLYRTHAQSRVIEEFLIYSGIPYTVVGGFKFYDRKEIKDLIAYLKLIVNPLDDVSFIRAVGVPRRGIGKVTLGRIGEYATEHNTSLLQAAGDASAIGTVNRGTAKKLIDFAGLFKKWRRAEDDLSITELVTEVLDGSGYRYDLEQENTVEARTRLENIAEFLSVANEYDKSVGMQDEASSLADFLAGIALITDLDNYDGEVNQVSMMTLHSAKGLEYPVVFLTGMEEGIFPHVRSLDEEDELEEERRLCYVGITRAEEKLHLTYCEARRLYGDVKMNYPSRFFDEIPEELLEGDVSGEEQAAGGQGMYGAAGVGGLRGGGARPASGVSGGNGGHASGGMAVARGYSGGNGVRGSSGGNGGRGSSGKSFASSDSPKGAGDSGNSRTGGGASVVGGNGGSDSSKGVGGDAGGDIVYGLGDKVVHRKWGSGVIVAVKGDDRDQELRIAFPKAGVKTFIAKYAPLKRE